MEKPFGNHNTT